MPDESRTTSLDLCHDRAYVVVWSVKSVCAESLACRLYYIWLCSVKWSAFSQLQPRCVYIDGLVVFLRGKVPYHQRLINLWNIVVYVSPEMFSFPSVLTDALHCWMVRVFTHPIMPIGPEGGGFTASSLPPPHTNLPWFSEDPVSLSLRDFFLSLTWAKHTPVFLRPL